MRGGKASAIDGDRDAVGADPPAARVAQDGGRGEHGVVVEEGLPLSLEDDACDGAVARVCADREDLLDDLPRGEVA